MRRYSWLLLLTAFCSFVGVRAWAAGDAPKADAKSDDDKATANPEEYLKSRGLKLVAPSWILQDELDVNTKLNGVEKLKMAVFKSQKDENFVDKQTEQKKADIESMLKERITLREQLKQSSNAQQQNRIILEMNGLVDKINLLEEELQNNKSGTKVRDQLAKTRDDYVKELLDIRKKVNGVQERYADLSADKQVSDAIEAYNKAKSKETKLGPGISLASNDKRLKKYEELVLADSIDIERVGSQLWEISVVFNNGKPLTMALDTGASVIALSYEAAKAAGITPSDTDPTIKMQMADGHTVEAKKVIANSVRVGKFTVEKVECAVLPAQYKEAASCLGQSFLKHFTYKIDTEKSKLVMTKVETALAPGAAPKPTKD